MAHEERRITLAQMEGFLAGWRELRGVTREQHAKGVASGTPLARAFSCGLLRSPYKSELARRLEISKIASLNLNLFFVTLEAGEAGVPKGRKGKCPFKRMKSRNASKGSLTCALNLHSTFLRVNGVIEISTTKRSNRLKFVFAFIYIYYSRTKILYE